MAPSINVYETTGPAKCQWCGVYHKAKCPLVGAFRYDGNGKLIGVEFHAPRPIASGLPHDLGYFKAVRSWGL
jgi:hypothetical protein